jgi:hypothetical protein
MDDYKQAIIGIKDFLHNFSQNIIVKVCYLDGNLKKIIIIDELSYTCFHGFKIPLSKVGE